MDRLWRALNPENTRLYAEHVVHSVQKAAAFLPGPERVLALAFADHWLGRLNLDLAFLSPLSPIGGASHLPALWLLLAEADWEEADGAPQLLCVAVVLLAVRSVVAGQSDLPMDDEQKSAAFRAIRWLRSNSGARAYFHERIRVDHGVLDNAACVASLDALQSADSSLKSRLNAKHRQAIQRMFERVVASQAVDDGMLRGLEISAGGDDEAATTPAPTAESEQPPDRECHSADDAVDPEDGAGDESGEVDLVSSRDADKKRADRTHRLYLNGRFSEWYRDNLSMVEARAASLALLEELKTEENRVPAALALLQGLTSEKLTDLAKWKVVDPERLQETGEVDTAGHFLRRVPGGQGFWKPGESDGVAPNASLHCRLRLPEVLVQALELSQRVGGPLFPSEGEAIDGAKQLMSDKVRPLVSRFGQDRWRTVLPTSVYKTSGDSRFVQLIAGDGFGLSTSPLHYLAVTESTVRAIYAQSLRLWFGSAKEFPEHAPAAGGVSEAWIGSSIGCIPLEHVRRWVSGFRPEILDPPESPSIADVIAVINQWSRWATLCLSAALATRGTSTLAEVSLSQVSIKFRAAFLEEKTQFVSEIERARALGKYSAAQIENLLAVYRWALSMLPQRIRKEGYDGFPAGIIRKIRKQLSDACSGDAALLLAFDQVDGSAASLTREWLRAGDRELPYPDNVFRHLVATNWVQSADGARQLFAQLGHSNGYAHAHGIESTESLVEFFDVAGAEVDRLLNSFGFEPLATGFPKEDFDFVPTYGDIKRQSEAFDRSLKLHKAEQSKRLASLSFNKLALKRVERWLELTNPPRLAENVDVPLAQLVQDTQADCQETFPFKVRPEVVRVAVCNAVRRAAKQREISLAQEIPYFYVARREDAPVGAAGLSALAVMCRARAEFENWAMQKSGQLTKPLEASEEPYLTWLTVLLLYQPFKDIDALWTVFDAAPTASWCDKSELVWLRLDNDAACCLPGWFGAALAPIVESCRGSRSIGLSNAKREGLIKEVQERLLSWVPSFGVEQMLETCALAARVELPGNQWTLLTEDVPSPQFHYQRARNWISNSIGGPPVDRAVVATKEVPPAAQVFPETSEEALLRLLKEIGNAFRSEKTIARSRKLESIGNARPTKAKRTLSEARQELCELEQRFSLQPWKFPWLAEVALKFAQSLAAEISRLDGEGPIALGTAQRLFSPVKKKLIPLLVSDAPESDDAETWLDYYLNAMSSVGASSRDNASNAFWRWHRVLCEVIGAERISGADWPFRRSQDDGDQSACSGFLSEAEHDQVLATFDSWIEAVENDNSQYEHAQLRLFNIARLVWLLCWNLGLRGPTEACGLSHGDTEQINEALLIHIRRSPLYPLKTRAAERTLCATNEMREQDLAAFMDWITRERESGGENCGPSTFVFPELAGTLGAAARRRVLAYISVVLRHVTNDQNARVHWGRRGFATRNAAAHWAYSGVSNGTLHVCDGERRPLSELIVLIGHTVLSTTHQAYIFLRDLRIHGARPSDDILTGAWISGVTRYAYSMWSNRKRKAGKDPLAARAESFLPGAAAPGFRSLDVLPAPSEQVELPGVLRLGYVLHALASGATWRQAVWRAGYTRQQLIAIGRGLITVACHVPDLLPTSAVHEISEEANIPLTDYRPPPHSAARSRRSLPELRGICLKLDKSFEVSRATTYSQAIQRALLSNDGRLYTRDARLIVQRSEDAKSIEHYLTLVTDADRRHFKRSTIRDDGRYEFALSTRVQGEEGQTDERRGVLLMVLLAIPVLLGELQLAQSR